MSKKKHHKTTVPDCGDGCCYEEVCGLCEKPWPCEDHKATKDYKIERLEAALTALQIQVKGLRRSYEDFRELERRLQGMECYNQRLFDLGKKVARLYAGKDEDE